MTSLDLPPGGLSDEVVSLRHWEERDVSALVRALQDGDVARWVLQIPSPYTEEHARSFLGMAAHARVIGAAAHLAVVVGDEVVGAVALTSIDWNDRAAELGYWTATAWRGRGVATRSSKLALAWAFGDLGIERVALTCEPANVASVRVATALGFEREGYLRGHLRTSAGRRDSLLFGLLAPEG